MAAIVYEGSRVHYKVTFSETAQNGNLCVYAVVKRTEGQSASGGSRQH